MGELVERAHVTKETGCVGVRVCAKLFVMPCHCALVNFKSQLRVFDRQIFVGE